MLNSDAEHPPSCQSISHTGPEFNPGSNQAHTCDHIIRAMMDASPVPMCAVDSERNIRLSNPAFHKITRALQGIWASSRVTFQSSDTCETLRQGILQTLSDGKQGQASIPVSTGAQEISVLIHPLSVSNLVLLTFLPPHDLTLEGPHLQRALQVKWSLSRREADCGILLSQGKTARRIAQDRDVSIATVRTQLQAIREKLGVASSLEAAVMINGFARPTRTQSI